MAQPPQPRRISWLTLIAALGLSGYFIAQSLSILRDPGSYDQLWQILLSERMLAGAQLYGPRIMEVNPPLSPWFHELPVLLAHLWHSSTTFALNLITELLALAATLWSVRILALHLRRQGRSANPLLLLLAGAAVLWAALSIGITDFGQRDQLLFIVILPYVFATATGTVTYMRWPERCALGVFAAFGLCMRPQHLLEIAALQVGVILLRRRVRPLFTPELLSLAGSGLLYLVIVVTRFPTFFRLGLPLVRDTYWAYSVEGPLAVLLAQRVIFRLLLVVVFVYLLNRERLQGSLVPPLLLVFAAALTVHCLQHAPFGYHLFPAQAFLDLAALFLVLELLSPWLERASWWPWATPRFALAALCLLVLPLACLALERWIAPPPADTYAEIDPLFEHLPPHTPVFIFSTSILPFKQVYLHQLEWASRFGHLWPLPAILFNEHPPAQPIYAFRRLSPNALAALESYEHTSVDEDLERWQPAVILVEHCSAAHRCQALHDMDVDVIPWFLTDPRFAAIWSHYRRQPGSANFDLYSRVP